MDDGADEDLDPAVAERVRRDLAGLAADDTSAPAVPEEVSARVVSALRAQPAHSIPRPRLHRLQRVGLVVGVGAAVVGAVVGALMLTRESPAPPRSPGPTAQQITVSRPPLAFPLSEGELTELLGRPPDYGPLHDPGRRASCLAGLGYPAGTPVLGAKPLDVHGQPAVILLLAADPQGTLAAKLVSSTCSAATTGLLAETTLARP